MTIVITGATGHLGRLIVEHLTTKGVAASEIVAGGRDADKLSDLGSSGVRTAVMDYDEPSTLAAAFVGAQVLVLVSGSVPGQRLRQHQAAIDAARDAGVGWIIYTSAPRADTTSLVLAPEHKATEEALRASGVPFTVLRNNWYTENYLGSLTQARETGLYVANTGSGRVASASRTDFAEAAAAVVASGRAVDGTITPGDHDGAVYELAGDHAWDGDELARAMSDVIGSAVDYLPVSADEHRARLVAAGLDEGTAGFVVALDDNIAEGALALTDGTMARLIGRPTTPLVDGLRAGVE